MCVSCSIGLLAFILAAFFIGSIPFGVLLAKAFGLPDPRTIGSKNIGATNMLRTGRKDVAALTLLLDAGKGVASVLLATQFLGTSADMAALALLFTVLGHMYSPWLGYAGGKGVATSIGGVIALSPVLGAGWCAAWLVVFGLRRISSLAALTAFTLLPVTAYAMLEPSVAVLLFILSIGVIAKHRANIERLYAGTEPRFVSTKGKHT